MKDSLKYLNTCRVKAAIVKELGKPQNSYIVFLFVNALLRKSDPKYGERPGDSQKSSTPTREARGPTKIQHPEGIIFSPRPRRWFWVT